MKKLIIEFKEGKILLRVDKQPINYSELTFLLGPPQYNLSRIFYNILERWKYFKIERVKVLVPEERIIVEFKEEI